MSTHTCERCGSPAQPIETASHTFCEACRANASTGARSSSELLFTLRPPPMPERGADPLSVLLDHARAPEPRISFPTPPSPIVTAAPTIAPPPGRAHRLLARALPWLALSASAFLFAGSAALAFDAREREANMRQLAEGVIVASAEPSQVSSEDVAPIAPIEVIVAPAATQPNEPAPPTVVQEPAPLPPSPRPQAPRAVPRSTQNDVPSRAEVQDALAALRSQIAACAGGGHGVVDARVTFVGTSGRASHAEIAGGTASPETRSCMARAMRGASLPPFGRDRFTVVYPYRY